MIKRVSALILLFVLVGIFSLFSCENKENVTPEDIDDVVGEWFLEHRGDPYSEMYPTNITATFEKNHTGTFKHVDGTKSWSFTWSYDEKANRYLIYRANDEYVRFASISNNEGVSTMYFIEFVGTKVK